MDGMDNMDIMDEHGGGTPLRVRRKVAPGANIESLIKINFGGTGSRYFIWRFFIWQLPLLSF